MNIIIEPTEISLAERLATDLEQLILQTLRSRDPFYIAVSGGNSPKTLFRILTDQRYGHIPWNRIHVFWADERCVPPDHPESNYGMTKAFLFDHINIPEDNIHRIMGENNPADECVRYRAEINTWVPAGDQGIPSFDMILLGMGDDGHTASIFPGQISIFNSNEICETARHPVTGQSRISMTGTLLNHAKRGCFFVTGENKSKITSDIINKKDQYLQFPAAHVNPVSGECNWYLDKSAAKLI